MTGWRADTNILSELRRPKPERKVLAFVAPPAARTAFSQPDLIIAATALHHGLTVVSRDVDDYRKARAVVLNPWD